MRLGITYVLHKVKEACFRCWQNTICSADFVGWYVCIVGRWNANDRTVCYLYYLWRIFGGESYEWQTGLIYTICRKGKLLTCWDYISWLCTVPVFTLIWWYQLCGIGLWGWLSVVCLILIDDNETISCGEVLLDSDGWLSFHVERFSSLMWKVWTLLFSSL